MSQHIGALTLLVADYDQAIRFFTEGLGFALLEDTRLDEPGKPGKRWVRVAPKGASGSALLLAQAANAQQQAAIGQQGGGRVFLFLETTDFWGITSACRRTVFIFVTSPVTRLMAPWWCLRISAATGGTCCNVLLPTESENVYHPACHKVIKVSQKILIIGAPIFTEEREGNG